MAEQFERVARPSSVLDAPRNSSPQGVNRNRLTLYSIIISSAAAGVGLYRFLFGEQPLFQAGATKATVETSKIEVDRMISQIVLDDQLVQRDECRMDWFRALLTEKAHTFQIVVFTCRPSDYLAASAFHGDTDGGFVRAVDLSHAVRRV